MEDVVTKIRDRLAKPPGMGRSDHSEIAFIVEDVPGIILPLRNKLFDFLDERGVLVVTPINVISSASQAGRAAKRCTVVSLNTR